MMIQTEYFDRPGPTNTGALVAAVARRREELGIEHLVVASDTGATARALHEAVGDAAGIVCVPEHAGFGGGDEIAMTDDTRRELEGKGVQVLVCSHALSGVGRSVSNKFSGVSHVEIIAATLRLFGCEGLKVAVEVSVMAADAGLVPTDRELIAIGGSGGGADCAAVIKPAHMNNFFELEIREIIAKARSRG